MQESIPRGADYDNPKVSGEHYLRVMDLYDARRHALQRIIQERFEGRQADFARATGIAPTSVSRMLKDDSSEHRKRIGDDTALKIEDKLGLPPGTMLHPVLVSRGERVASTTRDRMPTSVPLNNNPEYPAIPRVHFKLAAGVSGFAVEFIEQDAAPIVFRRDWYESRGLDPHLLFAINVAGQSMEPTLWDGDTVVVNTGERRPIDGRVYAVNYEGELVIKRLLRDEGAWWLVSDNPDQRRFQKKRCHDDTHIIGRVVHKQSESI